jgi:methylenetetrahydrofolate--tRNA-(uracil-5-)-methyltransferase
VAAPLPGPTTAIGALLNHITGGANAETFQPMNVNFGLFPELTADVRRGRRGKAERKRAYTDRAKADWQNWLASLPLGQRPAAE